MADNEERDYEWSVTVGDDKIQIDNKFSTTKLYVNGVYQDVYYGVIATIVRLYGKLSDGRQVKVVIGGELKMHCSIFVDCECVFED